MPIRRIFDSIALRVHALLGRGFSRSHFERLYARGPDAWGCDKESMHHERIRFIVDSIPARPIARALELGCAEGQMTELLAARAQSVVAIDFVEEAVHRARARCSGLAHVEFSVGDLRAGLPSGPFDLVLGSDVFYYLSPSELRAALRAIAGLVGERGALVAAEFSPGAARLPSRLPDLLRLARESPAWTLAGDRSQTLREDGRGVRVLVLERARGDSPP
jgi:SAM-dependent methyltransferase